MIPLGDPPIRLSGGLTGGGFRAGRRFSFGAADAAGPVAVTPVAARFWRVVVFEVSATDYLNFSNVEFRETVGVTQLPSGGTAIASSEFPGGYEPAKAFDGLSGTRWVPNSTPHPTGEWVGYDYGAGNTVTCRELAMTVPVNGTRGPISFALQYSQDGTAWTTLLTEHNAGAWTVDVQRTFDVGSYLVPDQTNAHRYWRIYITQNNGGPYAGFRVLRFKGVAGGGMLTGLGTPIDGGHFSTYGPEGAFWKSAGTGNSERWLIAQASIPGWVGYDFPEPVDLAEISMYVGTETYFPTDFLVEHSDDGVAWTTRKAFAAVPPVGFAYTTIDVSA